MTDVTPDTSPERLAEIKTLAEQMQTRGRNEWTWPMRHLGEPEFILAFVAEIERLRSENLLLVESADLPCRVKRQRLQQDRVIWTRGDWELVYCQTASLHQGEYILWRGEQCEALGSREWCESKWMPLPDAPTGDGQ